MSEFRSGDQVLQAARMLLSPLPEDHAGLIVEGRGDRQVFSLLCYSQSQITIANGKRRVREARDAMRPEDRGRFVFLVDCDDDVSRGTLRPEADLIISEHADLEGDLFAMGALEVVVSQLVRSVAAGTDDPADVAEAVLKRAVELAEPVGRVRRTARATGMSLADLDERKINYSAIRDAANRQTEALGEVVKNGGLTPQQARRLESRLPTAGSGFDICNGHDLVEAVKAVLIAEHRVYPSDARSVDAIMRTAMLDPRRREAWTVVRRLRRWEQAHGRKLLRG